MSEETNKERFLDPKILMTLSGMELKARMVVEGIVSGLHKSPYHGYSVEFAEHREYTPGDAIKHIDWQVFGKSDRLYVKRYEEETNLRCYILLDSSGSMGYRSDGMSKLEYGGHMAAALTYLMLRQQDSVGLVTFDESIRRYIPPRNSPRHLKIIVDELEGLKPGNRTKVSNIFHDLAERVHRRGLIIVLSDLFDDPEEVLVSLQHFRHKKHEVIVFHLLDPYELRFPFERVTLFRGLEDDRRILTEPALLRKKYLQQLNAFIEKLKRGCRNNRIDYFQINTEENFGRALTRYLG
ncbi:DUF58 domain-containing protein, partial [bacterium]|nr:DUF58 domain-containing protein [bacterium]